MKNAAYSMSLGDFLERAWPRYARLAPDAQAIRELLESRGERVGNDHIAFRTFNLAGIDRHAIGRVFENWGYRLQSDDLLELPDKKLLANYWLPPSDDWPKVFVSELMLERCSPALQTWVRELTASTAPVIKPEALLTPPWPAITFADYTRFYAESEYAAWTAAFGIQINHFTVAVNGLRSFASLPELNGTLEDHGFKLNHQGGTIKGTPAELLEQSSTMARKISVPFADGTFEVPGCYYEFARRYPVPGTDQLFMGFIPKSADKIFESTFNLISK